MNKLFVKAIKGLLDDTNLFTRTQWANLLESSQAEIERWLKQKAVPRSDQICILWAFVLLYFDKVPKEPISLFEEMAMLPSTEVSVLGEQMLPTVWEYMQKPVVEWS